jgi:dTDP-4-amino-4,6-dideoxygalactose transaminase
MNEIKKIPYVDIVAQHRPLKDALLKRIGEVIDSGQFVLGPEVESFEKAFAKAFNYKYAIGVNSGTDALFIGLKALGVGQGDEVITVANSFLTTVSSIEQTGAKPVFVDICERGLMDATKIASLITSKTKAILPVHLMGLTVDMSAIMLIAKEHGLKVIEDCAQAVGAQFNQQYIGSQGDIGAFSLHPLKTLGAIGDAGVIVCQDEDLFEYMHSFRNVGLKDRNTTQTWGINSRLDSIQAAALNVKLKYLNAWTDQRRENANLYFHELQSVSEISLPKALDEEKAVYHTFAIRLPSRDMLKVYLEERGIGAAIHYPIPIHLQPAAKSLGYKVGDLPRTEAYSNQVLSLPIYPGLTEEQILHICNSIKEFIHDQRHCEKPVVATKQSEGCSTP